MSRPGRSFSLLELIVAVAVLATALLGLMGVVTGSNRVNALSRERTQALTAAITHMDQALAEDWASLTSGAWAPPAGQPFDVAVETGAGAILLRPAAGRARVGLVTVTPTSSPDLRLVEVSARWRSAAGQDLELTLHSLVARR